MTIIFKYDIVISEQRNDPQNGVRTWMVDSIGKVRKQMEGYTLGGRKMRIAREFTFYTLQEECWDCDDVLDAVYNADKEDDLMMLLEDVFNSEVPTLTEVNDLLRFDGDWVLESLGIDPEDDEEIDD